ncbi:hypothetical protein [Sporosarcina pasteurii]|uniref:Uncharacterized protein n=1 Tax=Sporosarcina pasteurii TaxID=1474 RepID=A0A380BVS7_SPOPA|nr:hypothetical protein [Sporosarcina pasteurii]MDS9471368.1 hypothetical protein [Sporosarcina pasteurii]QBQ05004.1 hypothetical protein E2C16_04660 [Sporosarcina pasteurii]SUJ08122.1 Uncharacterised protein [Sporosarcina pasteurii]
MCCRGNHHNHDQSRPVRLICECFEDNNRRQSETLFCRCQQVLGGRDENHHHHDHHRCRENDVRDERDDRRNHRRNDVLGERDDRRKHRHNDVRGGRDDRRRRCNFCSFWF